MVSTASALDHDEGMTSPAQVQDHAPPRRGVREAAAVDAQHEVARLDAEPRRAAARANGRDAEAARVRRLEPHAEQLLAELRDLLLRDRLRRERDAALRSLAPHPERERLAARRALQMLVELSRAPH